jgi:hypothetical protein
MSQRRSGGVPWRPQRRAWPASAALGVDPWGSGSSPAVEQRRSESQAAGQCGARKRPRGGRGRLWLWRCAGEEFRTAHRPWRSTGDEVRTALGGDPMEFMAANMMGRRGVQVASQCSRARLRKEGEGIWPAGRLLRAARRGQQWRPAAGGTQSSVEAILFFTAGGLFCFALGNDATRYNLQDGPSSWTIYAGQSARA